MMDDEIREFLSTLPVRGATRLSTRVSPFMPLFLSTLPVRGATQALPRRRKASPISIHAPREGSDWQVMQAQATLRSFLSTLPVRGATLFHNAHGVSPRISIHAPREGSDTTASKTTTVFS